MISYERLCALMTEKNWALLIDELKPKYFPRDEQGNLIEKRILAKVAEMLTDPQTTSVESMPAGVKILLLKCLVNSCVDGYTHEKSAQDPCDVNNFLSETFPYDQTLHWAVSLIHENTHRCDDSKDRLEMLRLCVQFLCNFVSFACKSDDLPSPLTETGFKSDIIILVASDYAPLCRAACAFAHNTLRIHPPYYRDEQMCELVENLVKANDQSIYSADEALQLLLQKPNFLPTIYNDLTVKSKLYLLGMIHHDVSESAYSEPDENEMKSNLPLELVRFLSEKFKKQSDLILKTVDSYLDGMVPTEVTLLLDIIGVVSSKKSVEGNLLQSDKSLAINCIYLLKSLHMAGRTSDNYFTPVQKLNAIAPCNLEIDVYSSEQRRFQDNPAFGFKASLIKAIGNLVHKHRGNQQLLRETDAIPLLLDCCNIDARNPLIMQWAILALRNSCDECPENQEIIRNCNRIGVIDNEIIREMGMKLHEAEDGKAIGIVPLPREINK